MRDDPGHDLSHIEPESSVFDLCTGERDGDFEKSAGLGSYCLMSAGTHLDGGRTPAAVCAYLRHLVGWCPNEVDLRQPGRYEAKHGAYDTVFKFSTDNPDEYFLVENRSQLLAQHTTQTGQRFEPDAIQCIYHLGQGHPWLTNALADRIVDVDLRDRSLPVTAEHVEAAKETLIVERRTHIDSLVARLREPRVRRILEPMLVGDRPQTDKLDDDLNYVVGLGLVTMRRGFATIANPIYREVIPRALTYAQQVTIPNETIWYMRSDGSLDMPKLMAAWQVFWRKDGHLAAEGFGYREAGPHLMLMAFLQRIVNSGGRAEREYGLGRGALDLVILWRDERHVIEMKLRRDTETEEEAFDQLARYLDHLGLSEGWLVLFDLRKTLSWAEKLTLRDVDHAGKQIHVVGC